MFNKLKSLFVSKPLFEDPELQAMYKRACLEVELEILTRPLFPKLCLVVIKE